MHFRPGVGPRVAQVVSFLRDASGPLYNRANHEDLRRGVGQALSALDPFDGD